MKFGVLLDTHVDKWDVAQEAEELGYHRAWFPDSHMIWSDCYVSMAVAATKTSRILLGTGITNAGTRLAPVTANTVATINQIAPGRVFLGIGTGHTSMRVMGQPPVQPSEFDEYVRVVRGLLRGEAVDFTMNGRANEIQFLHRERRYINLEDPIPVYVAANGPKALRIAAEQGDGWITAGGITSDAVTTSYRYLQKAAAEAGRILPDDYLTCNMISACVLQPGEKLTDPRVVDQTGSTVTGNLHFTYEIWEKAGRPDKMIPQHFAEIWDEYVHRVENFSLPPRSRFRQIHEGHATYLVEEERRFVTPSGIRASCVVGRPEEIVEQLRTMEAAGMKEIALIPPAEHARDVFRDIARWIMPHFA